VGGITNDVVQAMLATRHVFVLPSSFEGLPVSLIEAMANGCVPVVAAMRSGVPDLIDDGRNGFLFDIGDTPAATRALARLAGDEDLRMTMARAAYETVRSRYTIEQVTQQYVALFERMLAAPYRRPTGQLAPPRSMHTLDANMPPFPLRLRKLIYATRELIS
jgi:glycosyltransferase involved in cell wall biosynthesis